MEAAVTNRNKAAGDSQDYEWPLSPTLSERFYKRLKQTSSGCLEWTGYIGPNGYGQIGNSNRKVILTHRAAWMLNHGRIAKGMFILHKCDNRPCCNIDHLFIGTQMENVVDMHRKGRARKALGIDSSNGRLTWEEVCEIRRRWIPGWAAGHGVSTGNTGELAEEFGCSRRQIISIGRGEWRKHA
ncbi:HNH endonuclease signature motif containing protein [Nocardia africana]